MNVNRREEQLNGKMIKGKKANPPAHFKKGELKFGL